MNRRPWIVSGMSGQRRGSALLVVMVVVALVSYACYRFTTAAMQEHRSVAAEIDRIQLELVADSAEQWLTTSLQPADSRQQRTAEQQDDEPLRNISLGSASGGSVRERFTVVGSQLDDDNRILRQYAPVSESTRLSLAAVAAWEKQLPGSGRSALLQLPGVGLRAASSILSQLGVGRRTRQSAGDLGGIAASLSPVGTGETESLPSNYHPVVRWEGLSLEELLSSPAISRNALYGIDRNRNLYISAAEAALAAADTPLAASRDQAPPLELLVTPYSAELNTNRDGRPRVYLNAGNVDRLRTELAERLPPDWVDFIVAYRKFGPVKKSTPASAANKTTSKPSSGGGPTARNKGSGHHRIESVIDLIGAELAKSSDDSVPNVPNPLTALAGEDLIRLMDEVTVDSRDVIPGRIDINQAPPAVLRCIPGMDESLLERILAGRQRQAASIDGGRHHAVWLMSEGWISGQWMRKLEPYITVRGDIYRAQIVGYLAEETGQRQSFRSDATGPADSSPASLRHQDSSPFVRREVVIDATQSPPCVIYRRDLTDLGRGYSLEVLTAGRYNSRS